MRSTRVDWLIFLALGFMWGSSYLFIKIGVQDFGTFTLVALRLAVGAALLWTVLRVARTRLPRTPRVYGHLLVMALVNITIPFLLITWAEKSVESALAAVLTSLVIIGFIGVVVLTSREMTGTRSDILSDVALVGSSISYAAGAVYSRRNVRGLDPMIPATFQVTFAAVITVVIALLLEHPWDVRPQPQGILAIVWLGLLGSGLAYLAFFHLLGRWGATRTALVAYVLPVVGIALGFFVLQEPIDGRIILGTALIIGGVALVNSRYGRRLLFARSQPRVSGIGAAAPR